MRLLWVVALLAACNQVYGLDETNVGVPVFDSDGDGILDEDDNCLRVANADQADVDGNGQGDACSLVCLSGTRTNADRDRDRIDDGCDPCPRSPQTDTMGRPIDEDGDGIVDACDNCPGVANANQANSDVDDLGDACDDAAGRVLFDAFRRKQTYWSQSSWKFDDGFVVSGSGELRLLGIELFSNAFSQRWAVDVGFELPSAPSGGAGVYVRDGAAKRGCVLSRNNGGWDLIAAGSSTTIVAAPAAAGVIRLRAQLLPMAGLQQARISCQAAGVTAIAPTDAITVSITLSADTPTNFTYVDLSN